MIGEEHMSGFDHLFGVLSATHFLKEFTFSKNKFVDEDNQEKEFADCVIWLEDLLVIFQLKERSRDASSPFDPDSERKWFENKVLKRAKGQIKTTMDYFKTCEKVKLTNHRGHQFNIKTDNIQTILKAIIYKNEAASAPLLYFHVSRKYGFLHIIDFEDYKLICQILDTPFEISEYLTYRERFFNQLPGLCITEKSLLGAYLKDLDFSKLLLADAGLVVVDFEDAVDSLINEKERYDINHILSSLTDNMYYRSGSAADYYKILIELAKMTRIERDHFKLRWEKCGRIVLDGKCALPFRMVIPRTKCGMVFIPVEEEHKGLRFQGLQNLTAASKYDFKLNKHIGISFCKDNGLLIVDYIYIEYQWKFDRQMQEKLKANYPFRPVSEKIINRYAFQDDD